MQQKESEKSLRQQEAYNRELEKCRRQIMEHPFMLDGDSIWGGTAPYGMEGELKQSDWELLEDLYAKVTSISGDKS